MMSTTVIDESHKKVFEEHDGGLTVHGDLITEHHCRINEPLHIVGDLIVKGDLIITADVEVEGAVYMNGSATYLNNAMLTVVGRAGPCARVTS